MIRKRMVESAKECMKHKGTKSEIYGKMQEVFIEMDSSPVSTHDNVINDAPDDLDTMIGL